MVAVAVGGAPGGRSIEAVRAVGDDVEDGGGSDGADNLRNDVRRCVSYLEAPTGHQPEGDGRIEVSAGNVTQGIRHG